MIADAHGMPILGVSTHLIANSWTTANAFRRSLALNLTRMGRCHGLVCWALLVLKSSLISIGIALKPSIFPREMRTHRMDLQ